MSNVTHPKKCQMSHIQKKCHHTTNRVLNGTLKTFKGQRFNFNIIWSALKVKRCVSTNFQWLWRWRFGEASDHRPDPRMGFLHDLCLTPIPMMIMMMPMMIMMMPMKIMMGFLHDLCLTRCGFGNSHAAQKIQIYLLACLLVLVCYLIDGSSISIHLYTQWHRTSI